MKLLLEYDSLGFFQNIKQKHINGSNGTFLNEQKWSKNKAFSNLYLTISPREQLWA